MDLPCQDQAHHEIRYTLSAPLSRLIERIMQPDQNYCGGHLDFTEGEKKAWVLKAESEVESVPDFGKLRRVNLFLDSTSQGEPMKHGGIIGKIVCQRNLIPCVPVLRPGEWLHVSKQPAFGNVPFKVEFAGS